MFDLFFMLILLDSLFNYLCSGCLRGRKEKGGERERERATAGKRKNGTREGMRRTRGLWLCFFKD